MEDEESYPPKMLHLQGLLFQLKNASQTSKSELTQTFNRIYLALQSTPKLFAKDAPGFHYIEEFVKNISMYLENFEQDLASLKGIITLCNLCLIFDVKGLEHLSTAKILCLLAGYYSRTEDKEGEYQCLSLIAQVVDKGDATITHPSQQATAQQSTAQQSCEEGLQQQSPREWLSREFVGKLVSMDLEAIENERRRMQYTKILAIFSIVMAKNKQVLIKYKFLNSFKMQLLNLLRAVCGDKKLSGSVVYGMCLVLQEIKLTEKEISKFKIIETLMGFINKSCSNLLIFGAIKILKNIWNQDIRRQLMFKYDLTRRLYDVVGVKDMFILSFIQEINHNSKNNEIKRLEQR